MAKVFKPVIGMKLKHKFKNHTATVIAIGESFTRGVRFPFKTLITIKVDGDEHNGEMDLSFLRSNWKPV